MFDSKHILEVKDLVTEYGPLENVTKTVLRKTVVGHLQGSVDEYTKDVPQLPSGWDNRNFPGPLRLFYIDPEKWCEEVLVEALLELTSRFENVALYCESFSLNIPLNSVEGEGYMSTEPGNPVLKLIFVTRKQVEGAELDIEYNGRLYPSGIWSRILGINERERRYATWICWGHPTILSSGLSNEESEILAQIRGEAQGLDNQPSEHNDLSMGY